jgi:hypothetical protein
MGTNASTTHLVFRQTSPLVLAAVSGATALVLLVSLARDWAHNAQPLSVAWVLFGLACMWSLFIRPVVVLDGDGVTFRNVVRDIHIPWARVTDVDFRWNLKVFVGDRGYTSWAISSQVERPRRTPAGMFGGLASVRLGKDASAYAQPRSRAPKVTASFVARSIEQARDEYAEAVAHGALQAPLDGQVRVMWVPTVVAVLVLPAIAVVAFSLT